MLKRCIQCSMELPLDSFWRHSIRPSGYNDRCKLCARRVDRQQKSKPEVKAKRKDNELRKRYGINLEIYKKILEDQNYCCAICNDSLGQIQVNLDHCHETKLVRGILCNRCNTLLGNALDNVEILENAIKYLKKVY